MGLRGGEQRACWSEVFGFRSPNSPKGLKNVGNSCYANAVLQCLLHTALPQALANPEKARAFQRYSSNPNILAQGSGSVDSEDEFKVRRKSTFRHSRSVGTWVSSQLRQLNGQYKSSSSHVLDPGSITRYPHKLSPELSPYTQEDAHEFLRALLSELTQYGQNKNLSALFDGLLESKVTCRTCHNSNITRDRYMDLSLDISALHVQSIQDALAQFIITETLDSRDAVYCKHCKCKRPVTKGLRLATAPSVLVCHLKRFAYTNTGHCRRIRKHVQFPETLEISDYLSHMNQAKPPKYQLVGVLVHQGHSCDHGHYVCYVKRRDGWYLCNDAHISRVSRETVLQSQAYILFYQVEALKPTDAESVASQETDWFCGIDLLCGSHPAPPKRSSRRARDDLSVRPQRVAVLRSASESRRRRRPRQRSGF